jgi:hypothetical protein
MALMHGKLGRIEWDCDAVRTQLTLAQNWSCDIAHEVHEITSMGDTWKTYLGGFRAWTANVECLQDSGGPIITPFGPGDPNGFGDVEAYIELYLKYDAGNTEWRMVFGKCVCDGIAMGADNGIPTVTYTFQGTDMLAWDSQSAALKVY